jgi:uncharacterized membrane protein
MIHMHSEISVLVQERRSLLERNVFENKEQRTKTMAANSTAIPNALEPRKGSQVLVVLVGRLLYVLIFLNSGLSNFLEQTIPYGASHGVPMARLVVPASGLLALAGGLSVLLGYHAKMGAWLIVVFLVSGHAHHAQLLDRNRPGHAANTISYVPEQCLHARWSVADFAIWSGAVQP